MFYVPLSCTHKGSVNMIPHYVRYINQKVGWTLNISWKRIQADLNWPFEKKGVFWPALNANHIFLWKMDWVLTDVPAFIVVSDKYLSNSTSCRITANQLWMCTRWNASGKEKLETFNPCFMKFINLSCA